MHDDWEGVCNGLPPSILVFMLSDRGSVQSPWAAGMRVKNMRVATFQLFAVLSWFHNAACVKV